MSDRTPPTYYTMDLCQRRLYDAWATELTRQLDRERVTVTYPLADQFIRHLLDAARRSEQAQARRNARAAAWWRRSTGRTAYPDQPPYAPSADANFPSPLPVVWSGIPAARACWPACSVTARPTGARVAAGDLAETPPSLIDLLYRDQARWESHVFWQRVRHGGD